MEQWDKSKGLKKAQVIAPDFLLAAYAAGYFPMAESREGEIQWMSPDPRAIIPLNGFNVSRSLSQTLRKKKFEVRWNTCFEEVMRQCARREETWISEEITQSYIELHRRGFAHSLEMWHEGALAGGLYGVAFGAAFFGESMFSTVRDASKVALVCLVEQLQRKDFRLLDTQFITPHLAHFGAIEIPRTEYLAVLAKAVQAKRQLLD